MAKVGVEIGLTIKLYQNSQYEFVRPTIKIDDIDTDGDVDQQIATAVVVLKKVWAEAKSQVEELILSKIKGNISGK